MKRKNDLFILSILLCLIPFIISAVFYRRLPDQVVIRIDNSNHPEAYAPKFIAAFVLPFFLLCIHIHTWIKVEHVPKKEKPSLFLRRFAKWAIPVLTNILQLTILSLAIGFKLDYRFCISLIISILIIVTGNYLPKCRYNYSIGIKLPWTLSDEENWNKTHTFAGWVFIAAGLILFINAFLNIVFITAAVIILMAVAPFVYSFSLYLNIKQQD
jgi:uncharacterized membrane protein